MITHGCIEFISVESPKEQEERIHGWWIPAQIPTDKTLLYLHGGGHNNSAAVGGEDYLRSIREFEEFVGQK